MFEAEGITQLCQKHVDEIPVPLSERTKSQVSSQLEDAIMSCLEKSRSKRPQTARDLAQLISGCAAAGRWTIDHGDRWWGRHERGSQAGNEPPAATMDVTMDQTMDVTDKDESAAECDSEAREDEERDSD